MKIKIVENFKQDETTSVTVFKIVLGKNNSATMLNKKRSRQ
jgi:hypothetical protein